MAEDAARRLGRNLLGVRRRAGFSQEELAALCSMHRTTIGLLEQGRRLPRADTLIKLSSACAVSPLELLEGIEWTPSYSQPGSFLVEP